ncbi:MAG: hypothetical protein AAGA54_35065 [Myxococcota bacterium]
MPRSISVLLAACLLFPACDDKPAEEAPAKKEIKWPDAPTDGSNMVLELVKVEDDGATFKAYNFADKAVKQVSIRQRFLDADGKELDTFPHMQMGTIGAKDMVEIKTVIMSKPEGMTTVDGVLRKVKYDDGSEWRPKEE